MAGRHSSLRQSPSASSAADLIERLRVRIAGGDFPSDYSSGLATASASATPAAVLVPLVMRESGTTVLLTRRTAHLNDHAGQVSFPGGRREESDPDLVFTALREAREEVGIDPSTVDVLGSLPEFFTGTGFRVTPVVGRLTPPLNLKPDDFEVADIFEVPLGYLIDRSHWRKDSLERDGRRRQFWATDWDGFYIWGATAGMLVNLVGLLESC